MFHHLNSLTLLSFTSFDDTLLVLFVFLFLVVPFSNSIYRTGLLAPFGRNSEGMSLLRYSSKISESATLPIKPIFFGLDSEKSENSSSSANNHFSGSKTPTIFPLW